MEKKPRVLFLSAGNPTRSLMAESLLHTLAGDEFETASAGIENEAPSPLAFDVMKAVGIDLASQHPKTVKEVFKEHFGYVISIADWDRERSPIFPFAPYLIRWSLENPALAAGSDEERKEVFRRVRDQLGANVEKFVDDASEQYARQRKLAKAS
jgi:arsenate reductase